MDDEANARRRAFQSGALKGSLFVIAVLLCFAAIAYALAAFTS